MFRFRMVDVTLIRLRMHRACHVASAIRIRGKLLVVRAAVRRQSLPASLARSVLTSKRTHFSRDGADRRIVDLTFPVSAGSRRRNRRLRMTSA